MQIFQSRLVKYEMISVPVASTFTGTKINIPDQPNLRNVYVQSIDFPQINFDYYGNACLNTVPTYLISLFLTLNVNGYENIHLMPVTELKCANVNGAAGLQLNRNINGALCFGGQSVQWSKSYFTMPSSTPPGANSVIVLGVWYF